MARLWNGFSYVGLNHRSTRLAWSRSAAFAAPDVKQYQGATGLPPRRARGWSNHEVSEAAESDYKRVVEHLFSLDGERDADENVTPIDLRLSSAAHAVFRRFCNRHGKEQVQLGEHLSSAWSKLQGYAARLALVIQLVKSTDDWQNDGTEIDADSMRAGIQLAR